MYQNNPFQQGQALQMQQIPYHEAIHRPVEQLPNLPGVQYSTQMVPFAALVLAAAVNNIQTKLTQSWPRLYFFNVMAVNGYANAQFMNHVAQLSQYVELMCIVRNQPPQSVVEEAADVFTSYAVAKLALTNPHLMQNLAQQNHAVAQAVAQTVQDFEVTVNQIRQQMQQNRAGGNGMQAGTVNFYGNQNTAQNAGYTGNTGIFAGTGQLGGGAPFTGDAGMSMSMSIGSPTGGVNTAIFGSTATSAPATPPAVAIPTAASSTSPHFLMTAPTSTLPSATPAPSPAPAPAREAEVTGVGDLSSVKWQSSAKYPMLTVFDPNTEEQKFHVYSDGTIQPLLATKTTMDREQHLSPLLITPVFAAMGHNHAAKQLPNAISGPPTDLQLTAEMIQEIHHPSPVEMTLSHKESWLETEAYALSQRSKFEAKSVFALKYALLVDTLIASHNVLALIKNLVDSKKAEDAAKLLKRAYDTAVYDRAYHDVRAINRIIRRLIERTNRFVSIEMSLSFGTITDYIEDAPQLAAFFTSKVGQGVTDKFEQAHKRIMRDALNLADDSLTETINKDRFAKSPMPENEDLMYIHLYNEVTYAVADFSTIELRAQIPKEGYSALISESATPLLHWLAGRLFDRKPAQEKGGAGFNPERFLLRTHDGVVLEFARGALASNSWVVACPRGE